MAVRYRYRGPTYQEASVIRASIPTPPGPASSVDAEGDEAFLLCSIWYATALSAPDESALDTFATGRGWTKA